MFEKKYKNAMDNVTVDNDTREKIFDKIILKEEVKERKNPAIPWRIAFACVACIAIVFGIVFVPHDSFKPASNSNKNELTTLKVSKSYDEIYKLIKPKKDYNIFNGIGVDDVEVEYVDDTVYITNESVIGGADMDGNAMPGATKGEENTSTNTSNDKSDDFSDTTQQVEGVNEADIVKTDGKYIYYVNDTTLSIVKADGGDSSLVSQTQLSDATSKDLYGEMFLKDDRLILLKSNHYNGNDPKVLLKVYDISDRTAPKMIAESCQDGWYNSSRMVGDYIYLISNCHINISNIDKEDPTTFVPTTETNGVCVPIPADSIYRYDEESYTNQYTVIGTFNYKDGTLSDTASLLGGTDNIYCSEGNIILADTSYSQREIKDEDTDGTVISQEVTTVSQLAIKKGEIEYKISGEIEGVLENQFFIDEHNGYFRFVTTVTRSVEKKYKFENKEQEIMSYSNETFAQLTVLDEELKKVGEITDLAKGERVYSVRFMGDIAYFVTFRQTDPLFSVDLSDPKNPKILGELKIPGFSEYMYPYGNGLLLGFGMDANENTGRTTYLKLSMFDINDPANVTEQDKTVISGYRYSPALSSHKAMLVHPDKNLIGFAATDNWQKEKYLIYEYTGDGFERKAVLTINEDYNYYAMTDVRGLFINDSFYAVSDNAVQIFDMNTFLQIGIVKF